MAKHRHTVLIVDDEPDVVKSVKDLLRFDYNVLGATTADEGARLMAEHPVDVVMTDQRMPEVTGVEFLTQIKVPFPEATRLLFTGYADIRAVIDAINQGNVYRYITKPWDPEELQTVIREACERHDLLVQRRVLLDQLEHKNADLETVNAQLAQTDQLKTAFIRVASHELRTPLAIVNGYAQLAEAAIARDPSSTTPTLRDWIGRVRQAGARLQAVIEQITSMLHQNQFDTRADREELDVAQVLTAVADDLQTFVDERKQTLERDWPADVGTLVADAEKLRACLDQLVLNAIKFTPDGGRVTLAARRGADGGATFTVSDTGRGMDEATLKHFGQPFFTQLDVSGHSTGTHGYEQRGIGLGASLVQKFVELHGGTVDVRSKPGEGTTVTLSFPPAPAPKASEGRRTAG